MKHLGAFALAWIVVVLAIFGIHIFFAQRSGPIALTQIFEPYLVFTALLASPLAFRVGSGKARLMVAVLLVVSLLRYGPAWLSLPATGPGEAMTVVAWNLESRPNSGQRALDGLLNADADLVGLVELQPPAAEALSTDPRLRALLPHVALEPERTVRGVGLLSRYPILEHQASTDPPYLRALVDAPTSPSVAVYVVHPLPAAFATLAGIPIALESARRDADLGRIRASIDADLAARRPVIVMGDINTTEREPAYAALTAGLRDAHLDAGNGPGFTWRPPQLSFLPFGLLRIDYIFTSPEFVAQSTVVECGVDSDHCRLQATVVFQPPDVELGAAGLP